MLALRQLRVETELLKWLLLMAIAAALAMLVTTRMAGANDEVPGLLPPQIDQWAQPMPPGNAATFYPEVGPAPADRNATQTVWHILELQRRGMAEEALAQWERTQLGCEAEAWRQLAMGAAALQLGDAPRADEHFDVALTIDPENPVAHYLVATLRLHLAAGARNWRDELPGAIMLIALPAIVPNTRAMYELAAMQELHAAIDLADRYDPYAPLVVEGEAPTGQYLPVVTPTVGDLLMAIGADQFVPRAHNTLGEMYTQRGAFDEAEHHLDVAAEQGWNAPLAYRTLGKALEQETRYADAQRVFLKAFRHGDPTMTNVWRILKNGWLAD